MTHITPKSELPLYGLMDIALYIWNTMQLPNTLPIHYWFWTIHKFQIIIITNATTWFSFSACRIDFKIQDYSICIFMGRRVVVDWPFSFLCIKKKKMKKQMIHIPITAINSELNFMVQWNGEISIAFKVNPNGLPIFCLILNRKDIVMMITKAIKYWTFNPILSIVAENLIQFK